MYLLYFNMFYSNLIYLENTQECIMLSGRAVNNALYIFSGSEEY